MPKETIRGHETGDAEQDRHLTHIEVGWTKDCGVQLGLHMPFRSLAFVEIDPATGQHGEIRDLFNSLWAHPDRAQINRLIRALRKARDDAFGRDE